MAALAIEPAPASLRDLFDAAKRACDHWNDSPAARQAMERECREVPPFQRADLIKHFDEFYPPPPADAEKEKP